MNKPLTLQYLKGIGPRRQKLLAKLGLTTEEDLLYHFPRKYEDRTKLKPLDQLCPGETETVTGTITRLEELKPRQGLSIIKAHLKNGFHTCCAVWFNQAYLKRQLSVGANIIVTGKVSLRYGVYEIAVTDFETVTAGDSLHSGRIVPFYPSTEGLSQKIWREIQEQVWHKNADHIPEVLSPQEREKLGLCSASQALREIHFPESFMSLKKARQRLVFEEFYLLQLALAALRAANRQDKSGIAHQKSNTLPDKFLDNLPFALTEAQSRVIREVCRDMESAQPMQRLIQGDVGSGKTVVAAWALLKAVEGGYQGVMMAPTEILAKQHFASLSAWCKPLGLEPVLITGSTPAREKGRILAAVAAKESMIIVGTHALIQESVNFADIGVMVIDEQHRFGVKQRSKLEEKGHNPDVLVMSATPIPRTLAMTLYGDLDVSLLDELPPGRKPIETYCLAEKARPKLFEFLMKQVKAGAQVYIVCPLVEESEVLDIKNATEYYQRLQKILKNVAVGLLHGRMTAEEKERVMEDFRLGRLRILVSTTVIEVGVNIPNASVMVIEDAERFGLAQLHQLRGRVGRGDKQSYCLLMTASQNPAALQRLKLFTQIQDGFRLAEEDLKLRGPGEFFGMKQHGLPEFKLADVSQDTEILAQARNMALSVLQEDPDLIKTEHRELSQRVANLIERMIKY